jgi:hypothetical protein
MNGLSWNIADQSHKTHSPGWEQSTFSFDAAAGEADGSSLGVQLLRLLPDRELPYVLMR